MVDYKDTVKFPVRPGAIVKADQLLGLRDGFVGPAAPGDRWCIGVAAHDAVGTDDAQELTYVTAKCGVFSLRGSGFRLEHVGHYVYATAPNVVVREPYGLVEGRSLDFPKVGRVVQFCSLSEALVRVEGI